MKRKKLIGLAIGLVVFSLVAQADWEPARRLTWTTGASTHPVIAADASGGLHLVWVNYSPGNAELYYKKSLDGGTTWSTGERLTQSSYETYELAVAADPLGKVHVVWEDGTIGDIEIYYKRSK